MWHFRIMTHPSTMSTTASTPFVIMATARDESFFTVSPKNQVFTHILLETVKIYAPFPKIPGCPTPAPGHPKLCAAI